ncbi:hypothetical protein HRbin30_03191 [bacterium HR30]|nr:hypothetical protein HRbin30_03191 [bacterium HR30]
MHALAPWPSRWCGAPVVLPAVSVEGRAGSRAGGAIRTHAAMVPPAPHGGRGARECARARTKAGVTTGTETPPTHRTGALPCARAVSTVTDVPTHLCCRSAGGRVPSLRHRSRDACESMAFALHICRVWRRVFGARQPCCRVRVEHPQEKAGVAQGHVFRPFADEDVRAPRGRRCRVSHAMPPKVWPRGWSHRQALYSVWRPPTGHSSYPARTALKKPRCHGLC